MSCCFDPLFIIWRISSILRSENQPFFIIVLIWSATLSLVVWNLLDSSQISSIVFLFPFLCRIAPKITGSTSWLSYLVYVLCWRLWFVWLLWSSFVYQKKKQRRFVEWLSIPPCYLSVQNLLIMTPRFVVRVPRFIIFRFDISIMGRLFWLYQTQELFKICEPVIDVTKIFK